MKKESRSSNMIREITLKEYPVLTLLPAKMLYALFVQSQKKRRIAILLDPYFPPDYIAYCYRVLDGNQYPIHFSCVRFFSIIQDQLQNLRVDTHICFSNSKCITFSERCHILFVECTEELHQITLTGGTFIYWPGKNKKYSNSFRIKVLPSSFLEH